MTDPVPLVTIGIPTYRRPELLRRAIGAALSQDHGAIEVLVSDNASGDATATVCAAIAEADPRLRFLQQPENLGASQNFLAVLEAARGEYFMWLGDDDWIDANYVSACLGMLAAAPDVAVVGGITRNYRDGELIGQSKAMNLVHDDPVRRVTDYYATVEDNPIFYGVMRRTMIASCVLRNTLAGDWLLMAQAAFHGKLLTTADACFHRERANSTAQSIARQVQSLRLPRVQQLVPITSIAVAAMRDVLRNDVVFGRLSAMERSALASAIGAIVLVRVGVWMRVRKRAIPILGQERATRWRTAVSRARRRLRARWGSSG